MELITGIKERRSVRKYTEDAVTVEDIEKLVEIAKYAPSWKNTQTVRYNAVFNKETMQKISEEATYGFAGNQKILAGAPCLIVMSTKDHIAGYERDGSATTDQGDHWQSFDAGIAAQTFCLAAHEAGFGTVIMGIFEEAKVKEIINLPEGEIVTALIAVGKPKFAPDAPPRKELEKLLRVVE